MKYHIAVTTLNRETEAAESAAKRKPDTEKTNYLRETLHGLFHHAGLHLASSDNYRLTVFDSGSSDTRFLQSVCSDWPTVKLSFPARRLNLVENSLRALEIASEDSEYVCLVQDDIIFRWWSFLGLEQLIAEAEKQAGEENFGYITLIRAAGETFNRVVRCYPDSITGACLMVFRSRDIKAIRNHRVIQEWQQSFRFDYMLRQWAKETARAVFCPRESWIQHIGDYSSLRQREVRRFPLFSFSPAIDHSSVQKSLENIGDESASHDFNKLFPGGIPSRNRQWKPIAKAKSNNGIVIHREDGAINLDTVATTVWEQCNGERGFDQLIASLAALHHTTEEAIKTDVVTLLLDLIDRDALCIGRNETPTGVTRLMKMVQHATPDQFKMELQKCNAIHLADSLGQTVLHYAIRSGRDNIVSSLLDYNPLMDAVDHIGHTPRSLLEDSNVIAP